MLDFKPTGDLIAPPPLAECPASRFVLYQLEFSPEEIEVIRAFVNTDGYRAMTEAHTQYYRVARSYEFEQRDPWQVGFAYLQATWEVDDDPSRYREYAARAIQSFEQYVVVEDPRLPQVMWSFLLIAELKRRTAGLHRRPLRARRGQAPRSVEEPHRQPNLSTAVRAARREGRPPRRNSVAGLKDPAAGPPLGRNVPSVRCRRRRP